VLVIVVVAISGFTEASGADDQILRLAIQDQRELVKLYMKFSGEHFGLRHGSAAEDRLRLAAFRTNIGEVLRVNSDKNLPYNSAINRFSIMTDEERALFAGFNATANMQSIKPRPTADEAVIPEAVDWVTKGVVTHVSDQGMCGSCWTFSGVGPLEGRYALQVGTLKKFSEQEALECVYKREEKNGCRGGQYFHQWDWYKREGRATLAERYPYKGKIFSCRTKWYPNELSHAKVTGYSRCSSDESGLETCLSTGPVAVGIRTSSELYQYNRGVFMKEQCGSPANHAVVAVGYTKEYYTLKNSWGERWGESGFVKWSRTDHTMCDIHLWGAVPHLEQVDETPDVSEECKDTRTDCEERKCGEGAEWKEMGTGCAATCGVCGCRDAMTGCAEWATDGYCAKPNYAEYMAMYCPMSCRKCKIHPNINEDDQGKCEDTVKESTCKSYKAQGYCEKFPKFVSTRCRKTCNICGDTCEDNGMVFCHGECRHAHMC